MRNAKNMTGKDIETYTFDEVFAKRSAAFGRAYAEESLRLMLAQQIRNMRIEKNLTQSTVAKRAGTPQSVIARLESGTHSVSVDTLGKVAYALGKHVSLT